MPSIPQAYIYALTDPTSNEVRYIGKTNELQRRYTAHLAHATNENDRSHRANWIRKLASQGREPGMIVLEVCDESEWRERERHWIRYYRDQDARLTNGDDGGHGGNKMSPEVRARLSRARRGVNNPNYGRPLSEVHRERLREVGRKRTHSVETRKKLRQSMLGRKQSEATLGKKRRYRPSPEMIERMRERATGRRHTEETRRKLSELAQSRPEPSAETIEKWRIASTGRKHSEETKQKIAAANRNPKTEEHKQKLREAARLRIQRQREVQQPHSSEQPHSNHAVPSEE